MDLTFYNPAKALLYIKEIERGDVIFFDIHPTNVCNHNCLWCKFAHDKQRLSYQDMVAWIDKYPTVKGVRISGGGEPLVNPDTLPFIEECIRRGISVGIFSNGGLLNDDNIPIIGKCRFCRISLDAFSPETHKKVHRSNDFNKVLENITKLKQTGIRELGISFMVTEYNVEDIPLLPSLNLLVDYAHFKPINSGIGEDLKLIALLYLDRLEDDVNFQLRYSRVNYDSWANRNIPCRITKIVRAIASDNEEYVCCEHNFNEPQYNVKVWDGDNGKCQNCVYNAYNEMLDMYYTNAIAKEFF